MKDLLDELQATSRAVGTAALPAGEAHVVRLSRCYPAEVTDVWDALTNPERIPRWFLPVTGDLELGGHYQLEGNAGGEVRHCEPPHRLEITWVMGEPAEQDASLVEAHLEPDGEGTRLTLTHTAVVPDDFWDSYGPGAVGVGWDLALLGLAAHLAGVEMPPPEQLETDPSMQAALLSSSQLWGTAYSASGVDSNTVEKAVAGTSAFYVPPAEGSTDGSA
jgi:uncharacterized protein YndB with AHSA1/START domain